MKPSFKTVARIATSGLFTFGFVRGFWISKYNQTGEVNLYVDRMVAGAICGMLYIHPLYIPYVVIREAKRMELRCKGMDSTATPNSSSYDELFYKLYSRFFTI